MNNKKAAIALGAATALAILSSTLFLLIAHYSPATYRALTDESTGVELATAIFYLGAGLALLVATFRYEREWARRIMPTLLAIFFVFIAGEEESWGMWIFGFEAPSEIAEINMQNEINVHNLDLFAGLLEPHRILNLFIILFTIVVPIVRIRSTVFRNVLTYLNIPISDVKLIPWFAVALCFDRFASWLIPDSGIPHWLHTEVAEFLYAAGLSFFVFLYIRSISDTEKHAKPSH